MGWQSRINKNKNKSEDKNCNKCFNRGIRAYSVNSSVYIQNIHDELSKEEKQNIFDKIKDPVFCTCKRGIEEAEKFVKTK